MLEAWLKRSAQALVLVSIIFLLNKSSQTPGLSKYFDRPFSYLLSNALHFASFVRWLITDTFNTYVNLINTAKENEMLRKKIILLESQMANCQQLQVDLGVLTQMLELRKSYPQNMIMARSISGLRDILQDTLWIDKGTEDGVYENAPVLNRKSIIGIVQTALPRQSQVLLLSNRYSIIDVLVFQKGIKGLIQGQGFDKGIFRSFDSSQSLEEGDMLISLGTDDIFPRGIPVAKVTDIQTDDESGSYIAKVNYLYQPHDLDFVIIVTHPESVDLSQWGHD